MTKGLQELSVEAYENSKDKGFHDNPKSFGDDIALMHSELSEALEDYRAGRAPNEIWYEEADGSKHESFAEPGTALRKPCGIPSEMADVIIRVLDFCGKYDIPIERAVWEKMRFNSTRPRMHGGKKL